MTLPRRLRQKAPKERGPLRSPGHLQFVRSRECSIPGCEGRPIEAAHVRTGTDGGMSVKPGDQWAISLCAGRWSDQGWNWVEGHHAEQHRIGEQAFEKKYGIDMKARAREFAAASDPLKRYFARKARAA